MWQVESIKIIIWRIFEKPQKTHLFQCIIAWNIFFLLMLLIITPETFTFLCYSKERERRRETLLRDVAQD